MKFALGIPLLLLVVATRSTRPDDLQLKTTQSSNVDASTSNAEPATSSAASSPAPDHSTEAPQTAAPETSHRLLDTVREESPDYHSDETYEAVFGEDGLHPASGSVEGASSAEMQGRGESLAPSGSTATVSRREESSAAAAIAVVDATPAPTNWIFWLPPWCRHWPLYGPLGVPHDMQLQAFAEALANHAVGIGNYWVQAQESTDTDEHPSTEEPHTHFLSIMVQQVEALQKFYRWIYQQLSNAEDNGDFTPESLYRFLDALQRHAALVESVCNWSPSMPFTCDAPDSEILRNFFRVMDRQSIWINILNRWAASRYNLTAGPRRNPHLWLPSNLNEGTSNGGVSHTLNQKVGDNASSVDADSSNICIIRESGMMVSSENSEYLPSAATAHSNYCSATQLEQQKGNNQERKLPTCVLQSLSKRGHEAGQLIRNDGIPISNPEAGNLLENAGDVLGAASAHPQNGLDGYDRVDDDNPDEGFYDEDMQTVLQLQEWKTVNVVEEQVEDESIQDGRLQQMGPEERNLDRCLVTPVLQELGSGFDPHFLLYVKCNERGELCEPPEKCMPVSSVVTVKMMRWATLPEFPHSLLGIQEVPNDRLLITLLVATSCACIETSDTN